MSARRPCLWMLFGLAAVCGCSKLDIMPFFDKEEAARKNVREALNGTGNHSRLIGDYIRFADSTLTRIRVQGVGLVDRLSGTGEDPPNSPYRTQLIEDMRRHEIKDPNSYLASLDTALVIVTAYIDPIMKKGEKIDVEVTLPDGSEATSLAGGWLMPCHLREHALLGGEVKEGREIAIAAGPILIDALGDQSDTFLSGHRRGRIPAGAVYAGDDRYLTIGIGNEYRTVRMSTMIANRIGRRFHDYDPHGIQRPLAKAKTDALLELIVHDRYRDNWPRYVDVIRHMALSESPVDKHLRMQKLSERIQFGPTSEKAALELEAIGPEALPTLKAALRSPDLEARFHAAEALAYLGNADGVPALKEAADKEPAFRIFALTALSTLQDGSAALALQDLMNHDSTETRYGAFRALSRMSPDDPMVRGIELPGRFTLHEMDSTAAPLIHVTRYKRAEIVVFGAQQQFLLPMIQRAGSRVLVQGSPRGDRVLVRRIAPGEADQQREVSPRVGDVIRAAAELGAAYPDLVQMLIQCERQQNLAGRIAVDELPRAGRIYTRPSSAERPPEGSSAADSLPTEPTVQVGGGLVPNLFEDESKIPATDPTPIQLPDDPTSLFVK